MTRAAGWTAGACLVAVLALWLVGQPACADGACSCPTVTAQAATVEHQATVIARQWHALVSCDGTLQAVRATCEPRHRVIFPATSR